MPKFKDALSAGKSHYTVAASGYFRDQIFDTAKWIYPDTSTKDYEALSEEEKKKLKNMLSPEQVHYLAENAKAVAEALKKDVFEYTFKLPMEEVDAFCTMIDPNYRKLTAEEQLNREQLSARIRQKFTEYTVEKELMLAICDPGYKPLLRPEKAMVDFVCSEKSIKNSQNVVKILTGNDIAAKQQVYSAFFDHLEKLDLTGLDVMDDKNLVDNFDRFKELISVGPEIVNLIKQGAQYGMDFSGNEKRPFLEKMGMIADIAYLARYRIDIISHPIYSQARLEDLEGRIAKNIAPDEDGDKRDIGDYFNDRGFTDINSTEGVLLQCDNINDIIKSTPGLFDKSLSLEERMAVYRANYWGRNPEIHQIKNKVVLVNGKLVPVEPKAPAPEAELEEPEEEIILDDRSPMRKEFDRNIALIREIIPEFTISEDRIARYMSERRLASKEKLAEYARSAAEAHRFLARSGAPSLYARNLYTFYDPSGDADAAEKNEKLREVSGSGSKEGDDLRVSMYLDTVNAIQELDTQKLSVDDNDLDDILEYVADKMAILERGMEWQKVNQDKARGLGITFSPEDEKNLKVIEDKGVALGGFALNYRKLAELSLFNTFPYEDLTMEQANLLFSKLPKVLRTKGADLTEIGNYMTALTFALQKGANITCDEPEKKQYTADDVIDIKPSFDQAREKLFSTYAGMLQASTLKDMSRNNEFTRMMTSLQRAVTVMAMVNGPIDAAKAADLRLAGKDLVTKVQEFIRKTPDQLNELDMEHFQKEHPGEKLSDFDQIRFDLAREMKRQLDLTMNDAMFFDTMVCRHNDSLGVGDDPKVFSDYAKMTGLLDELGLEYSDVVELAKDAGITPDQYIGRIYEQNQQAKMPEITMEEKMVMDKERSAKTAEQITEFNTLGDIEHFLGAKGEHSLEQLVMAFKACNRISSQNPTDVVKCYQAGELLNEVGKKISHSVSEKLGDKSVLDTMDIKLARSTMKRHFDAAEVLKTKGSRTLEESEKIIKAVEKGGLMM